jgi:hypothetical protein
MRMNGSVWSWRCLISQTLLKQSSVLTYNSAPLEALFSSWNFPPCSAINASLLPTTRNVIESSTFAFNTKNMTNSTKDTMPWFWDSTIVLRRMSRHLSRFRCLRPQALFPRFGLGWKITWAYGELIIQTSLKDQLRTVNYQWRNFTWMYMFSKQGKHLNTPIATSKLRACILNAKVFTVLNTVVKWSTCNPFIKHSRQH